MGNTQTLKIKNTTNKPVRFTITDPKGSSLSRNNPEAYNIIGPYQTYDHESWGVHNFLMFKEKFQLLINCFDVECKAFLIEYDSTLITYTDCNYEIIETNGGLLSIQKVNKIQV